MRKIAELFGHSSDTAQAWPLIVDAQHCPFQDKKCFKTRKSDPTVSIGTCTVRRGKSEKPIVICPARLLENRQLFIDCLHLLTQHEPGNQLHLIPEVKIPGGMVDFFLVSARDGSVKDFAGIELQAVDTTGSIWPARQQFLEEMQVIPVNENRGQPAAFGINWKMSAKTILVQMHHKARTFEHFGKKLVLVVQDEFLAYMTQEFNFAHLHSPPVLGDSIHFHAYRLTPAAEELELRLATRLSTDCAGIASCLDLQAEARVELEIVLNSLHKRLSSTTLFNPFR